MKIRIVGAEFFHVDGQTDMTKQKVAFRTFAKAPKSKPWTKGFWQGSIRARLSDIVKVFHQPNFFYSSQNFLEIDCVLYQVTGKTNLEQVLG